VRAHDDEVAAFLACRLHDHPGGVSFFEKTINFHHGIRWRDALQLTPKLVR
jgi:hypothetical protein